MRMYKFRGFHPDESGKTVIKIAEKKIKGTWFYGDLHTDGPYINEHKVLPETVGQYANFNDADGKELFDADIVRYLGESDNGLIVFDEAFGMYQICYNSDRVEGFGDVYRSLEKIGNAFENPELLEVEE